MVNIDYNYLISILVDRVRSTDKRLDYLRVIGNVIKTSYDSFKDEYNRAFFIASHNYQVLSIEHLINSEFILTSPAYIIDGSFINQLYIGLRNELYISNKYIYNRSELTQENYLYNKNELDLTSDFYVVIDPNDTGYSDSIYSLVLSVAKGGKKFEVITV